MASSAFRNLLAQANTWLANQVFNGLAVFNSELRMDAAKTAWLHFRHSSVARLMIGLTNDPSMNSVFKVVDDSSVQREAMRFTRANGVADFPQGLTLYSGVYVPWSNLSTSIINANPGAILFPNGWKIQGGSASLAASQTLDVVLPMAYSSKNFAVVGNSSGALAGVAFQHPTTPLTTVRLVNNAGGGSIVMNWLSFGL